MNNTPAVPMNNGAIPQRKRLAAGEPCDGQKLPAPPAMPKTPA